MVSEYTTDIPYNATFDARHLALHLSALAGLSGAQVPDPAQPFRYIDLGCGDGYVALVLGLTYPHAKIVGVDMNEDHIKRACRLAEEWQVDNVDFIHADFQSLKKGDLPQADYISMRGLFSWLSDSARDAALSLVGQHLKPGGLFMVHYMAMPGFLVQQPVLNLVKRVYDRTHGPLDQRVANAKRLVKSLYEHGDGLKKAFGATSTFLKQMLIANDNLFVHDYMADIRRGYGVDDVATLLAPQGCQFVTSATVGQSRAEYRIGPKAVQLVEKAGNKVTGEMLADTMTAIGGRIDIFQKTLLTEENSEQQGALPDSITFRAVPGPTFEKDIAYKSGVISITSEDAALPYKAMLDDLAAGASNADLMAKWSDTARILSHLWVGGKTQPVWRRSITETNGQKDFEQLKFLIRAFKSVFTMGSAACVLPIASVGTTVQIKGQALQEISDYYEALESGEKPEKPGVIKVLAESLKALGATDLAREFELS